MEQEITEQTLETFEDRATSPASGGRSPTEFADPSLSRSSSSSRLNAGAPEFVPRAATPPAHQTQRLVKIHHGPPPPPPLVHHVFQPLPPSPPYLTPAVGHGSFEYFGGGSGGGFGEHEAAQVPADPDPAPLAAREGPREGLSEEVTYRITKQVEYYFSDINLATTEHLMKFISKDPEGFVPMSVIASFRKIKALVQNNYLLAIALRTSSKLVVSDDGKKVRRQQPFTDSDVEELQSRIVIAENLPEDHSYQGLMKRFSVVGSVKTIRTCYPQTPNGTTAATNRSTKMDMLFGNRLHAFVEYEALEDAERAVAELNDERNWRSGLRVRLLHRCMTKHGSGRGRRGAHEGDGNEEEDASASNQPIEKQVEDPSQLSDASPEHMGEEYFNDRDGGVRRGRGPGRGRGVKGRGRGQYHNNQSNGGHAIGTPPSSNPIHAEQPAVVKQPPGPRMPDGTRGFTVGRGKPLNSAATA